MTSRSTSRSARRRTLRARLGLWFAAVVSSILVGFSVAVYEVAVVEPELLESNEGPEAEDPIAEDAEAAAVARRLLLALLVTLPLALGAAIAAAFVITRRGLQPLDDVIDVAGRAGVDRLDLRVAVPPDAPDEVARLGAAINTMLGRLQTSVSGLHRFTADASHELRTPLARLRGGLETSLRHPRSNEELRAAIADALDESASLVRLTETLLTLSRADAGDLRVGATVIDVGDVVTDVCSGWRAFADGKGLSFSADVEPGLAVAGDGLWVFRVVANLVENACKFTPSGGTVSVRAARAGEDDSTVVIAVVDDGPGFATEEVDRVFERFFRGRAVRGAVEGFGLGLPLARDIARALGGDLVVDAAVRAGARVVFSLPAARPASPVAGVDGLRP